MSWTVFNEGDTIHASHITEIQNALSGVAGAGQAINLTQLNSSTAYALDVQNLDSTYSYGLRVRDSASNILIQAYKNTLQLGATVASDSLVINAKTYLGDTANAKMTVGLTINQAGNDDEILALKSSDVAHGITSFAETDTYASMAKFSAANGGLSWRGFSVDTVGVDLLGIATNDNTTKSTAASGAIQLRAHKKSGAGSGVMGADANLVIIENYGTTRFILDAEGSGHSDVEWTTYDAYDDLALLNGLEAEFARRRDPVKAEFGEWLDEQRETLQRAKVVNFYDNGPRAMVNWTRHSMLLNGAIRQLGKRWEALEQRLAAAEARLALLPG